MIEDILNKHTVWYFALLFLFLTGCNNNGESVIISLNMNTDYPTCSNLEDGNSQKVNVILLLGQSNASGASLTEYLKKNVSNEKFQEYENGYDNVLINYCIDDQVFFFKWTICKNKFRLWKWQRFLWPRGRFSGSSESKL